MATTAPTSTNGTNGTNGHSTTKPTTDPNPRGMNYFPSPLTNSTLPSLANENAFLGDVVTTAPISSSSTKTSSSPDSAGKPMTCGFFRLEKGTPLDYTYTYHETKIVVSGTFVITEVESGRKVTATKGDVFYFGDGVRVIFENGGEGEEPAIAFFTGGREKEKMVY
ncbi:MAG: hypothetical protein M1828_004544 [Chrysothrix sp. TS-e1954]|nr:MAG: hypothetical protein M1828_004544 [Chrysothrix sp. TS-e1954]